MAVAASALKTKFQLKFEKGSRTYANCKEDAADENIFAAASTIAGLQKKPVEKVVKIVESELANA